MKRMLSMVLLSSVVAAGGCEGRPTAILQTSHFNASIAGEEQESYIGTGFFLTNLTRMPMGPVTPDFFILYSQGGNGHEIQFFRNSSDLPAVGTHPISSRGANGEGINLSASYSREVGTTIFSYSARSGEVDILTSTPEKIAGTFRFEAVASSQCQRSRGAVHCTMTGPADGARVLEIEGSFEAVPARRRGPGPMSL